MTILGGADLHRAQITYDYVDTATGEVHTGRVQPAQRETWAEFLSGLGTSDVDFVVEGCTGWWFVADEMMKLGMRPHVADPAEAVALRGRKKRAKTDKTDGRHLRQLLVDGRVPESWIPPEHMVRTRALGRLYLDLIGGRNSFAQRVHATLFHHGGPAVKGELTSGACQQQILGMAGELPPENRLVVEVGIRLINIFSDELDPVRKQLQWVGRHQPGAKAIQSIWGIGPLLAPMIWVELGDVSRFGSSRQAVRHTGLDVTVYDSDGKRSPGHLARQGPGLLRWALYEAAQAASRRGSPDHIYYQKVKQRKGHKIACLSVARKHARRCYHILSNLGDEALQEPTSRLPRPPFTPH